MPSSRASRRAATLAMALTAMSTVIVLGMSNLVWIGARAALIFLYKVIWRWRGRIELLASIVCVVAAGWLLIGGGGPAGPRPVHHQVSGGGRPEITSSTNRRGGGA